ncbi:MAG: hypothetical protein AABW45_02095, partial [Nanoarchaeota archaeon]
ALTNKEFKEAVELARESKKLSALTIASIRGLSEEALEKILEKLEKKKELEREIEVEIEKGIAKVKVKVGKIREKFILETDNKDEIIAEISSRTGLSLAEIEAIIEFEIEDEDNEDVDDGDVDNIDEDENEEEDDEEDDDKNEDNSGEGSRNSGRNSKEED